MYYQDYDYFGPEYPMGNPNTLPIVVPGMEKYYYQGNTNGMFGQQGVMPGTTFDENAAHATYGSGGLGGFFNSTKSGAKRALNNIKAGNGIAPNFAKYARVGSAVAGGLEALKGYDQYSSQVRDNKDLANDVLQSAMANPNYRYDLTSDQKRILRQLQNDTYNSSSGFDVDLSDFDLGQLLTGAASGFVFGGGPVGALLGASAGLAKGLSNGANRAQAQKSAELQNLYETLLDSERLNNVMRKDAALTNYNKNLYW